MPRGGRRPGAGAPRHNLNALQTGQHSVQLRAWMLTLLRQPFFRLALLRLLHHQKSIKDQPQTTPLPKPNLPHKKKKNKINQRA